MLSIFYLSQFISISRSRSKEIHKDAADLLEQIGDWVDKHKVGMCDFLFFALKKNIRKEAPELETSLLQLYNQFLESKHDNSDSDVTPVMGLALRV